MKFVSTIAIAASVAALGLVAAPAAAQKKQASAAAKKPRKFDVSKEAQKPIEDLRVAVEAKNTAAFAQLLAAAEAVAKNSDEKYLIARYRLQHAMNIDDAAATKAAVQAVLASGGADAEETASYNDYLERNAARTDPAAAEALYTRELAAKPNDLDTVLGLARAKMDLKKDREALDLLQRAIALSNAAGQKPLEAWYTNAMRLALRAKNMKLAAELNRELMRLYPSQANFKNAIALYREGATPPKEIEIDVLRLMRASGTMTTSSDYTQLASILHDAGLPGEAKSVLEAGMRAGVLKGAIAQQNLSIASGRLAEDRASLPGVEPKARASATGSLALKTGDAYLGYGEYAKAIELYRLALQKGGVDANLVNTRMGIALALAGQKAEAAIAFQAVSGTRTELAALWLAWLNLRG